MTEDKWGQVSQRLEAEADETVAEVRRMQEMLKSELEPDPEEGDPDLYEREKTLALLRNLDEKQYSLSRALTRMDDGTCGKCEICGNEIAAERLEALPYTTYCLGCKSLMERGIVVGPASELARWYRPDYPAGLHIPQTGGRQPYPRQRGESQKANREDGALQSTPHLPQQRIHACDLTSKSLERFHRHQATDWERYLRDHISTLG